MKYLLSISICILIYLNVAAASYTDIKLGLNPITHKTEIRYKSTRKKTNTAVLTVMNSSGTVLSTQNCSVIYGENNYCLCEALELGEGTYTVKMVSRKKTFTTQFIIWK
jgi:hypothetical protein